MCDFIWHFVFFGHFRTTSFCTEQLQVAKRRKTATAAKQQPCAEWWRQRIARGIFETLRHKSKKVSNENKNSVTLNVLIMKMWTKIDFFLFAFRELASRYVFVRGCAKSGTSWLKMLIDLHYKVHLLPYGKEQKNAKRFHFWFRIATCFTGRWYQTFHVETVASFFGTVSNSGAQLVQSIDLSNFGIGTTRSKTARLFLYSCRTI